MTDESLEQLLRELLVLDEPAREERLHVAFGDDQDQLEQARQRLRALEEVTLPAVTLDGATVVRIDVARLQSLFAQAVLLEPPARGELLARIEAEDPLLRQALGKMLLTDHVLQDRTRHPVAVATHGRARSTGGGSRCEEAGAQIGPWQLVRPLGRGGMGTVWLAQRADGHFQRVVALKLISAGQESQAIESRFLRERQILASLNHPNIAKLLDGGMAPDGRPYFVLEYVDGLPITQYCDQHQLRVVERLRLFLQVCRAVSHAHQRLVVHRDLKPSNILVTSERMVQLLDFGIAKLLHPDLLGLAELTRPEDQAMTPRYAAPEQIRNEAITTATDIYALGVLLYELLTGDLPYAVKDQAGHALERAILEQEPRRPGATLTDPSNLRAAAQASQRGSELAELSQQLSGDLETVLLKALKKSPTERYPSVEALSKDLEAFLDGMPVSAQPDSWRYRVGKFIGRHRTAVALGSLALLGLLAGLLVSLQQAARAEAVGGFLLGLFEDIDPARGDAVGLRARDLLDNGARRVDLELAHDPLLQARMNAVLGRLQLATGDAAAAVPRLAQAQMADGLSLSERQAAGLDQLRALTAQQRFDDARALQTDLGSLPLDEHDRARLLEASADLAAEAGQLTEAEQLGTQALQLWERLPGAHEADRARAHEVLAKVADLSDRLDQAEMHARQALALVESGYGRSHLAVARALERLANLQRRRGDLPAARTQLAEAIALAEQLLGADHANTLAMRRLDADLLEEAGELDLAAAALESVLADAERRYGRFHLSRALALNSLAAIDFRRRDLAAGAARMQEVVSIYRVLYGERHNEVATVRNNLANLQRERGRLDEAAGLMEEVLQIRRDTVGESSVDYAYSLLGVARIAQLRGADQVSQAHFDQAADVFTAALGEAHPLVYGTRLRAAHALLDQGQKAAAEGRLQALGEAPDASTATLRQWLQLRLQQQEMARTERLAAYANLVQSATTSWTARDPRRVAILLEAADVHRRAGEVDQAIRLRAEAGVETGTVLEPRIRALL
ncbi:MAG: protein kinase [Xanthomonadales bacterium]|nr:protein kinase [Xanthomonadales bacterium]